MEKVLIIGCGVIGGSLIKSLSQNTNKQLFYYDTDERLKPLLHDKYQCQYTNNFTDFEHIFLCVPINYVFEYLKLFNKLSLHATIYDCSSTKYEIEQVAIALQLNYVGFHPMCGSEKSGFSASSSNLFENKTIICTLENQFITKVIAELGADLHILSSKQHDIFTAQVSHCPQLFSLLVNRVDEDARQIAGPGFKDMTRISNSGYSLWEDIIKTNKTNILNHLIEINSDLEKMIKQLQAEDYEQLKKWFNQ